MWQSPARSWYYYPSCNLKEIAASACSLLAKTSFRFRSFWCLIFIWACKMSYNLYQNLDQKLSHNHTSSLCKPSLIFVLALLNQLFDHGLTLLHKLQLYDYLQKYFYLKTHALFLISHIFCAHLLSWSRAWITLPLPIYVMWKFKLL